MGFKISDSSKFITVEQGKNGLVYHVRTQLLNSDGTLVAGGGGYLWFCPDAAVENGEFLVEIAGATQTFVQMFKDKDLTEAYEGMPWQDSWLTEDKVLDFYVPVGYKYVFYVAAGNEQPKTYVFGENTLNYCPIKISSGSIDYVYLHKPYPHMTYCV